MRRVPSPSFTAVLVLVGWLTLGSSAFAQLSVELSPPNVHYVTHPGAQTTSTFTLHDSGDQPVDLSIQPSDFVLMPNGSIRPLPVGSLKNSMAPWLTINTSGVHLDPHGQLGVRYSIKVPASTPPGSYWAAVLVRSAAPPAPSKASGNSVGVQVVNQLAYVIIVDVGKVSPAGTVASISVKPDSSKAAPSGKRPLSIEVDFQNTGNAYMVIGGRLEVRKLDGSLVGTYPLPKAASLPGGVTQLEASVPKGLPSAKYLASAVLDYGSTNLIAGQATITVP